MVVASERFVAVGAFARARGETLINALFAEHMTASLDHSVLESETANGANGQRL